MITANASILAHVQREMLYLQDHDVVIGILDENAENGGVKILEYAIWNEYGTINIPTRPFFRTATQSAEAQTKIKKYIDNQVKQIHQKTGLQILTAIGLYVQGLIQNSIKNGNWKANAPATIAIKGKNNPLIDTGSMIESVSFEIRRNK